jgi:zinc and cadmium transporter
METLFLIILTTAGISFITLIGLISVLTKRELNKSEIHMLIAFAAGILLGNIFFHILPESVEVMEPRMFSIIAIITILAYFFLEKALHWHHNEDHEHNSKAVGYLSLIGDGVHNFVDGVVIASAFVVNPAFGFATAATIALHEIPQELSDFAIMIHSGFKKRQAVLFNLGVGITAVLGGIAGYAATELWSEFSGYMMPVAFGGFLYIALSSLFPVLRQEIKGKEWLRIVILLVLGLAIMFFAGD